MDKNKIVLDDLDLFIIKEIYERELTGTRILAVDYFFKNVDKKELGKLWREVDPKDVLINLRLKRLRRFGLVNVKKMKKNNGTERNEYSLNLKNIEISNHNFPDRKSKSILLKVNHKWQIFEI